MRIPTPRTPRTVSPTGGKGLLIGSPRQGTHTLGNWQSDNAIDVKVPKGSPIFAARSGTIGSRIGPLDSKSPRFQGQRLTVEAGRNDFYYAHLSKILVKPGEHVKAGQLIGYSGKANGVPHLHFASRVGNPKAVWKPAKFNVAVLNRKR